MKKYIEVDKEGLEILFGERVTFWCSNYIYTGKLVGVNDSFVKLEDAAVVYEKGELTSKDWKDAQKLPRDWYIFLHSVESFGILK